VPASYYDVNDDRACTALDILLVINHLNARELAAVEAAEAEAVSPADLAGDAPELEALLSDFAADVARQWRR